jgi:hypothetical protein
MNIFMKAPATFERRKLIHRRDSFYDKFLSGSRLKNQTTAGAFDTFHRSSAPLKAVREFREIYFKRDDGDGE